MGLFDFFKKNEGKTLSEKERYGQAWLQIVGGQRAKGIKTMKELSDGGFIEATIALAMFTENQLERKTLYKIAADANNPEGLWGYSGFLEHSFIPNPNNAADAKWESICLKAAKLGSVDAMNEMGNIYNRRNQFTRSMYWYSMANLNDFPNGEISLNGIAKKWLNSDMPYEYEAGDDFNEAMHKCALFYLEMWADQEFTTPIDEYIAMNLAGEPLAAYLTGDMFEQAGNYEMAYKMYNAIAFENDAHGIKCYADMLFTGRGVEKDMQAAVNMYYKAAELGDRSAMFIAGEFTKNNNLNLAAYWYGVSHSRGYPHSLTRLKQIANK